MCTHPKQPLKTINNNDNTWRPSTQKIFVTTLMICRPSPQSENIWRSLCKKSNCKQQNWILASAVHSDHGHDDHDHGGDDRE